jgi:hypothetical protein
VPRCCRNWGTARSHLQPRKASTYTAALAGMLLAVVPQHSKRCSGVSKGVGSSLSKPAVCAWC